MLVSLTSSACIDTPDLDSVESELTASYKAQIKSRTLSITGTNAASRLTLRLGATPSILEIDVGDDGSADFSFDRSKFDRIAIAAAGGNDIVTMNEQLGAFTQEEQVTIDGGSGDDTITGGAGAETIYGGPGNDTIAGRYGADTISLGAGDDTYLWEPGGASDVVVGDDGVDTLVFNAANVDEDIVLSADADHVRLTRNVALITLDLDTLEVVDLHTQGGADRVTIGDLSGTPMARVSVDLLSSSTGQGDAQIDTVIVTDTPGADTIDIGVDGTAVAATGLSTEVRVTNGEPALDRLIVNGDASDRVNINGSPAADSMFVIADPSGLLYDGGGFNTLVAPSAMARTTVNGLAGDDTIATSGSVTTPVIFDGGEGNDQLSGGLGADLLLGGAGNDVVDGNIGADTALLGDGDDTYVWDPGGSSDTIDGGAGADALVFNASAASETIDLRANGTRVSLSRDVGAVALDLAGIERFDVRARGGTDNVVVNSLTGTPATKVNVDLAASVGSPAGDAQPDAVVVNGVPGVDTIDVAAEGDAVTATGFGVALSVVNGEPALDRLVVHGGVLNVNGSPAADTMVVAADVSGPVYDGGGFNILVAPSGVAEVKVQGRGGDDWIGTSGSITTSLILDGGDGNDTIRGGAGADRLLGGAGNDVVAGGFGSDTVLLGDGDDTYTWNPGDSSDTVDGELGTDALIFNASNADETVEIGAQGSRVKLYRSIAATNQDLGGIERIDVRTRGGADSVVIADLSGTGVAQVNLELGPYDGSPSGDAALDSVAILGSPADDTIAITADSSAVVVSGLSAAVRVAHPDVSDQLQVHGAAGADTLLVGTGVDTLMTVLTYQD